MGGFGLAQGFLGQYSFGIQGGPAPHVVDLFATVGADVELSASFDSPLDLSASFDDSTDLFGTDE